MRRAFLLVSLLAACADQPEAGERLGVAEQRFASAGSVLVDLEFDAKLTADTMDPPKVRQLIASQLMYLVGQLNGEQSVGRQDRAEFSVTTFGSAQGAERTSRMCGLSGPRRRASSRGGSRRGSEPTFKSSTPALVVPFGTR
jgi:hypothetical protein